MATLHIFVSTGRFSAFREMRRFIDQTHAEGGDVIQSPFMREVGLSEYEPMCIEAVFSERPIPLPELLAHASWSDQWLAHLRESGPADAAICVFEPNRVEHPQASSLRYCDAFNYWPS
jgi:hypothetical protein